MVSYSRINVEDKDGNIIFEAPQGSHSTDDIELQEVRTVEKRQNSPGTEQLLSSFEDDESLTDDNHNENDGSKHTDNRLRDIEEGEQREGDDGTENVGASSSRVDQQDADVGASASLPNSSRAAVAIQSIRNNFNFLDRMFTKRGYERVGQEQGSGSENDGVFSNLSAKPDTQPQIESDKPPAYDEAAQDQTPPYWENSVLSPGFGEEVFVDGLPVGNIVNFVWNLLVSSSFQFVGFLLTYLLHTSHAAKQGSRAGLGITFITYGYTMIPRAARYHDSDGVINEYKVEPNSPNDFGNLNFGDKIEGTLNHYSSSLSGGVDPLSETPNPAEGGKHLTVIGVGVILFGVLILVKAALNYHRAKKMEDIILQPPANIVSPEEQV